MSPEELAQISDIVGDDISDGEINLHYSWNSYEQAKALLVRIRTVQKELRLLKQQISSAISSTKSEFTTERVSVGKSVGASFAAGLFGRKTMGRSGQTR
jgi:exonuclease VII small subunit